jgi:hypothetical protein
LARRELAPLGADRAAASGSVGPAAKPDPSQATAAVVDQAGAEVPTQGDAPSAEVLAEVLGLSAGYADRAEQARYLVGKVVDRRGVRLVLQPDGSIRPEPNPGVDPLSQAELSVLMWLRPAVVAELRKRQPKPSAKSKAAVVAGQVGDETSEHAPPVKDKAEIGRMIGMLTAGPADDDSDCVQLARRLVADPGFRHSERDPVVSEGVYLGWARDVKKGKLAQGVLIDAFEEACGKKVRNRGATMVAAVKRLKDKEFKARRGSGS